MLLEIHTLPGNIDLRDQCLLAPEAPPQQPTSAVLPAMPVPASLMVSLLPRSISSWILNSVSKTFDQFHATILSVLT